MRSTAEQMTDEESKVFDLFAQSIAEIAKAPFVSPANTRSRQYLLITRPGGSFSKGEAKTRCNYRSNRK